MFTKNLHAYCVIVGLLYGLAAERAIGDDTDKAAKSKTTTLIEEKPLAVDPQADEVTRLLIERRNAVIELLQATYALYAGGKGELEPVVMAAGRALGAQLEIPAINRIQILEQHVAFARDLNKIVDERYDKGVADAATHALARCLRLDMELRLARENLAAKNKPA